MRWVITGLVVSGLLLVAGLGGAAEGLVANGGFAEGDDANNSWPAQWDSTAGAGLYQMINDDGYHDNFALRYHAAQAGPGGTVKQQVAVQADTDYMLTAAMKSENQIIPLIEVYDPARQAVVGRLVSDGTSNWKIFSSRFNSGTAQLVELRIYGDQKMARQNEAVVGLAIFDEVQIYLASEAPDEVMAAHTFAPPGPNVALGKPYTLQPSPSYALCTDPDDNIQLTDGEYTVGYFWTQKSTVGWSNANPAIVTIDLGQVTAIGGVSLNTAAGTASVAWPNSIMVLVSDDGESWTMAGDLVELGTRHRMPDPQTYEVFRFATDEIMSRGRYVKFFIDNAPYTFVDEIEVYEGPAELLTQAPTGEVVSDPQTLYDTHRMLSNIVWRLRSDLAMTRQAINRARLRDTEKMNLLAQTDQLAREIGQLSPSDVPADFKTILPFNDLHARLYALHSPLHRAAGLDDGLTAWAAGRWDPLGPLDRPQRAPVPLPALRLDMMQGETRATAFNLTNAADRPLTVTISITGLPGGSNPSYLQVREVLSTDTRERTPIASALPAARPVSNGYRVTIPAGMVRQIWLACQPSELAAGVHQGVVELRQGGSTMKLPLRLRIADLQFPAQPDIHVGGWDYLQGDGHYEATPQNTSALIQTLADHYVDTPWGTNQVQPSNVTFDEAGALTSIAFDNWDEWVGKWPGARQYAVFMSVGKTFFNEPMGTPRFNRMINEWLTAWVNHLATQRLQPQQLVLLLVDEPHNEAMAEQIKVWAQAIKAAQPEVSLFEDPTFSDPAPIDAAFWTDLDIICPNLPMFISNGPAFRQFYTDLRQSGKELWFYSCSGPARLLDPVAYHRIQFWYAYQVGARGSFYWAFGDEAGANSWNAYLQKRNQYSPLFLTPDSVTLSKHMAAIGEGAQDFQYLVMLEQKVSELQQKGLQHALLTEAETLLTSGLEQVIATVEPGKQGWLVPKDRDLMDQVRVQALNLLEKLAKL